jgi:hypothetical protein
MLLRYLQVIAVTVYIFAAIGCVAYLGLSFFWLAPVLAPAIYYVFSLPDISPRPRVPVTLSPAPVSPVWQARTEARIAQLKSGPAHRNKTQYIDSVSRGIPYSDERIDYLEFPDRLVLCDHLRPLEAAMRAAKLPMENYRPGFVEVSCIMRVPVLQKRLPLDPCVDYVIEPGPDNHAPDINVARCSRCNHAIAESLYGGPWPTN